MKLYFSGESKLGIGYIPSQIIIKNGNTEKTYDISDGSCDYDTDNFSGKYKGDLLVYDKRKKDYVEMSERQEKILFNLLKNKNSKITMEVYNYKDDEEVEEHEADELTNCSATLIICDEEIDFDFEAEIV